MPFTFSHPAIILPLKYFPNKWYSLTGLVIGSMTPDFEYFIRMRVISVYSHTFPGLFWFDLPLGILLAYLYHKCVKVSLFKNLPDMFYARLKAFENFNWNNYLIDHPVTVLCSLLIGSLSHIIWDSFTHQSGVFPQFTFLHEAVHLGHLSFPMYKFLQHLSSLLGGCVVVFSLFSLTKASKEHGKINIKYWLVLLGVCIVIVLLKFTFQGLPAQIGNIIITFISAIILALILTPMMIRVKNSD